MYSPKIITIASVLSLSWLVSVVSKAQSSVFDENSFSLSTKYSLSAGLLNLGYETTVNIRESYSPEQQRAVFRFSVFKGGIDQGIKRKGEFYLDRKLKYSVLSNELEGTCRQMQVDEFLAYIYLDSFSVPDDLGKNNDLIVGPFRLLRLLNGHQSEFTARRDSMVSNLNAIAFDYQHDFPKFGKLDFTLLYPREQNFVLSQDSVPLKIRVYVNGKYHVGVFDFSRIFHHGDDQHPEDIQMAFSGMAAIDGYMLRPIVNNCSGALADKQMAPFAKYSPKTTKFSFKLERVNPANPRRSEAYVAYDARLGIMRIDDLDKDYNLKKLINFRLNKIYHVADSSNVKVSGDSLAVKPVDEDGGLRSKCIVAKLLPESAMVPRYMGIGKLVAGADNFVFMGRGQVRGFDANVYEATYSSLPLWLDQMITYKGENSIVDIRSPEQGIGRKSEIKYQTLLFVAADESKDTIPLMITIYKIDLGAIAVRSLTEQIFHLYDFSMDLTSSDEEKVDELFSLHDSCLQGSDIPQHGKVEISLISDEILQDQQVQRLEADAFRNLELITNLQDKLGLPATMIYDIESKLTKRDRKGTRSIIFSFRVAEKLDQVMQLKYLGKGHVSGEKFKANSFSDCLVEAGHATSTIVNFAYDMERGYCALVQKAEELSSLFEMFKISQVKEDLRSSGSKEWLHRMSHGQELLGFIDTKFTLFNSDSDPNSNSKSVFSVQDIKVHPVKHEDDYITTSSSQVYGGSRLINKLSGFTLPESDSRSMIVRPYTLDEFNWKPADPKMADQLTDMTYEQCQSACLRQYTCRTFSLCIKPNEIQCILSTAKLDFISLGQQLTGAAVSALKIGLGVDVDLGDGGHMELIKQPNCEIHNKLFIDLFELPHQVKQTISDRPVRAARSREECAEVCFAKTLQAIKSDVQISLQKLPYLDSNYDYFNSAQAEELTAAHLQATRSICSEFSYIYNAALRAWSKDEQDDLMFKTIFDDVPKEEAQGYCVYKRVRDPNRENNLKPPVSDKLYIDMEIYFFKFETFFEKKFGVSLAKSRLSEESSEAYNEASQSKKYLTQDQMNLLKNHIEMGDNFQATIHAQAAKCAKVCFLQSWGPWPACRSFDITVKPEEKGKSIVTCNLNSITVGQATKSQRYDLIIESDAQQKVWHYEPRGGFLAEKLYVDADSGFDQAEILSHIDRTFRMKIHPFGVVMLLIVGIVTGVFLGMKLGQQVAQRMSTFNGNDDLDSLVRRRPTIEFENQVNSEMKIPE